MITGLFPEFPIRPSPYPGESLFGFARRIHAANGHTLDRPGPVETLYSDWFGNGALAAGEPQASANGECRRQVLDLVRFRSSCSGYKYCAQCMLDIGYQLRTVDVAGSVVCPLHLIRLRSTCPACGGQITLKAISEHVCGCGARLDANTLPPVLDPVVALWEAKVLEALSPSPLPSQFRLALNCCMPDWFRSLTFAEVDRVLTEIRKIHKSPKEFCRDHLERTALTRWPQAFHEALRNAIAKKFKSRAPIVGQQYLFRLIPELKRLAIDEDIPSEVRLRALDFIDAHALSAGSMIDKHGRWLVNPSTTTGDYVSKRFVHAEELAVTMGWQYATLRSVIRQLGLPAIGLPDNGILLEQHVATEFARKLSGLVPLREAALSFGVNDLPFIQLLQRCGITQHLIAARPRLRHRVDELEFVPSPILSDFRRILLSRCETSDGSSAGDWKVIPELPAIDKLGAEQSSRLNGQCSWHLKALTAHVLAAILDGKLRAFCTSEPRSWRDIRVDPLSAKKVLRLHFNWRPLNANPSASTR